MNQIQRTSTASCSSFSLSPCLRSSISCVTRPEHSVSLLPLRFSQAALFNTAPLQLSSFNQSLLFLQTFMDEVEPRSFRFRARSFILFLWDKTNRRTCLTFRRLMTCSIAGIFSKDSLLLVFFLLCPPINSYKPPPGPLCGP